MDVKKQDEKLHTLVFIGKLHRFIHTIMEVNGFNIECCVNIYLDSSLINTDITKCRHFITISFDVIILLVLQVKH